MTIYPPFYTDHGLNLNLAERVFINQGCTFLDYAGIRLGERVMVDPRVTFITVGHPVDTEDRRVWLTGGPIDVAENVWIGGGATILPGVSIGRDSVIATGAVVADDVPTTYRRRTGEEPGGWDQGERPPDVVTSFREHPDVVRPGHPTGHRGQPRNEDPRK